MRTSFVFCFGLGMVLVLAAAPAFAQQMFFSGPINFPVGTGPRSIVMADFNGDGHLDFAVASPLGNSLSIGLGDGAGGLIQTKTVNTPAPIALGVGDF
jgi:hypothetical protein